MAKNKNEVSYESKSEKSRAERDQRVQAMRAKDGVKKPLKKSHKTRNRVLAIVGAALVIVILATYLLWNFGVLQRNLTALKVNQQTATVTDYNFSYYSNLNMYTQYFGGGGLLDLKASAKDIVGEDITWGDFFTRSAREGVAQEFILYQKALDSGYTLTDDDKTQVQNYIDSMQAQVGTPLDFELYLSNSYGRGFTVDAYRKVLERQTIASNYLNDVPATYEIKSEDVTKVYEEDKTAYDLVSYHTFTLVTPTQKTDGTALTDAEIAEEKTKNEELAKKIVEEIKAPEDVLKQAIANASEADKAKYEGPTDVTLVDKVRKAAVTGTEEQNWLFDDARKAGDKTYIASGNDFHIIYFLSREQDTRNTASFMVSSFDLKDSTGQLKAEADLTKIRNTAAELAKTFKTEADVTAYDDNTVTKPEEVKATKATKYENVNTASGSSVNHQVLNWALSPEAKAGTAHVIETSDKVYVVTMLERQDKESWYVQIEEKLQSDAFSADLDTWTKDPVNIPQNTYPGWWLVA